MLLEHEHNHSDNNAFENTEDNQFEQEMRARIHHRIPQDHFRCNLLARNIRTKVDIILLMKEDMESIHEHMGAHVHENSPHLDVGSSTSDSSIPHGKNTETLPHSMLLYCIQLTLIFLFPSPTLVPENVKL